MFSGPTSQREFSADRTGVAKDPGKLLLQARIDSLPPQEFARILFGLVNQTPTIAHDSTDAEVYVDDETVLLRLPPKILRVVFECHAESPLGWADIECLSARTNPAHEVLLVTTRPLSNRVKRAIDEGEYCRGVHYIQVSQTVHWQCVSQPD